jgi:hypothetical protein
MGMGKQQKFKVVLEKVEGMDAARVTVPFDVQEAFGSKGRVPVRGTINGYPYRSSIFPYSGIHYMVVNREVREGARVRGGDEVEMVMERDEEPRVIEPPEDLASAIEGNATARAAWDTLSYTHKKEYARSVEEAKRPETRARRIEKAVEELEKKSK